MLFKPILALHVMNFQVVEIIGGGGGKTMFATPIFSLPPPPPGSMPLSIFICGVGGVVNGRGEGNVRGEGPGKGTLLQ